MLCTTRVMLGCMGLLDLAWRDKFMRGLCLNMEDMVIFDGYLFFFSYISFLE